MWAENSADVNPSSFNILRMSASTFLCSFPVNSAISRLLIIANTAIRTDAEGRYCLNDLHKASGGEAKHRPSLWSENKQTKDLVAAIEAEAGIPALVMIHGGMTSGTYVAKDLVYSYAMWISPAFSLKVIRAYDRLVSGEAPMPFSIDNLPPAIARQVGGIIKAVVHKEVTEALSPWRFPVSSAISRLLMVKLPLLSVTSSFILLPLLPAVCAMQRVEGEAK